MGISGLIRGWRYSELNDVDRGHNIGLKLKISEPFRKRITLLPLLSSDSNFTLGFLKQLQSADRGQIPL
jgi:hypothetical protein